MGSGMAKPRQENNVQSRISGVDLIEPAMRCQQIWRTARLRIRSRQRDHFPSAGRTRYPDAMQTMPKQAVYAAGGVVTLAAVVGLYLGVGRSLVLPSGAADEAGTIVPAVTPVSSAKPILTPVVTMDEAEVRRLAREEAQAILVKSAPRKAPAPDDADDTDTEQLTPVSPSMPVAPLKPAAPSPPG